MRSFLKVSGMAILLLGAAALTTGAAADTGPASPQTTGAQGTINATDDQEQAFIKALEGLAIQTVQGLQQPTVGSEVPKDVKLTPTPPAAAAAIPEAAPHHLVKADDNTVLIVNPLTRLVMGVVSVLENENAAGATPSK
jgi:hypothetical protein